MKNTEIIKKYQGMNVGDLKSELKNVKKEHLLISLKVGAGKESDFSRIGKLRKNIARINSILASKESGENNG